MTKNILPRSGEPLAHYVNPAAFDPQKIEKLSPAQEKIYLASQWKLMWWKFQRHRIAVAAGIFLIFMYVMVLFAEVFAPYDPDGRHLDRWFCAGLSVYRYPRACGFAILT